MDPVTAIFASLEGFWKFLSTPEGQKVANALSSEVAALVKLFHSHTAAATKSDIPPVGTNTAG